MSHQLNRRTLLGVSAAAVAGAVSGRDVRGEEAKATRAPGSEALPRAERKMRLGMVTYNVAHDWDLETILKTYRELGLAGVEFRTTHAHGVEPELPRSRRLEIRRKFEDAGVVIWGPGSACEFHSPDPAVVRRNIEETKRFIELAHDLGGTGVKVRPNGFPEGVSRARTLEQIGESLRACGEAAEGSGVTVCCEMHGKGTAEPRNMHTMMTIADHPQVAVTWNSNREYDGEGEVFDANFELMRPYIRHVHINELVNGYPYERLFELLNRTGYDGLAMIEAHAMKGGGLESNIRFLKYYMALWDVWSRPK